MSQYPYQIQDDQNALYNTYQTPQSFAAVACAFPWQAMKVCMMPSADRLAQEGRNARWGVIWLYLCALMLLTGVLAFLDGRIPLLRAATTRPLLPGIVFGVTIALPLVFFLHTGIMQFMAKRYHGNANFLVQCYTILLIALPLVTLGDILGLVLLVNPPLSSALHSVLIFFGLALIAYCLILQGLVEVGIHGVSGDEAFIIVLVPFLSILALIAIVALVFVLEDVPIFEGISSGKGGSSSNSSSSKSGGRSSLKSSCENVSGGSSTNGSNGSGKTDRGDLLDDLVDAGTGHYHHYYHSRHNHSPHSELVAVQCPVCQQVKQVRHIDANLGVSCECCGVRMVPVGGI